MPSKTTTCPRRRWGKTNLSIPVITLGGDGFSNKFGHVTDEDACALIRRAVDLGANHFDLSRCYGDCARKVGLALKEGVVRRDELILNGRICCHGTGPWGSRAPNDPDYSSDIADYTASRAIPDLEDQLDGFGFDFFDAVLLHGPWPVAPSLSPGGLLEGLENAREQGLVRFIGYGMHHPPFHLEAISSGRVDVLLTYGDYNLLSQDAAEDVLPAAAQKDIGVLNAWSIREGLLTKASTESLRARSSWKRPHIRAEAEAIRLWCRDRDIDILQLALQFCLREERIHGLPIGCRTIEQLEQNVAAILDPLPDEVFDAFQQADL